MPSPCMEVQCLMGEPPPILLYCSWIFGVRRFAMNGPSLLQSRDTRSYQSDDEMSCFNLSNGIQAFAAAERWEKR